MIKFLFIEFNKRFWLLVAYFAVMISATLYGLVWDHTTLRQVYKQQTFTEMKDIFLYGEWI